MTSFILRLVFEKIKKSPLRPKQTIIKNEGYLQNTDSVDAADFGGFKFIFFIR